jgi:hypothetical protein
MLFSNEIEFDEMHEKVCGNSCFNVISGQYEPEKVECLYCGAKYTPQQTWFNFEANPEYKDGRKIGSGEYQKLEFEGEIPDEIIEG